MDVEKLLTDQKWSILKHLSSEKSSPLQLAEKSNTTMANISQQLRLLEAANLVNKEKVSNRDRGKPRSLFRLANDFSYVVAVMNDFADKKLLPLTDHHKNIIKIWFLKDPALHYHIEKIYWKIEPHMSDISWLALNQKDGKVEVVIASDNPKATERKIFSTKNKKQHDNISIKFVNKNYSAKISAEPDFLVLYDPQREIPTGKSLEEGD